MHWAAFNLAELGPSSKRVHESNLFSLSLPQKEGSGLAPRYLPQTVTIPRPL